MPDTTEPKVLPDNTRPKLPSLPLTLGAAFLLALVVLVWPTEHPLRSSPVVTWGVDTTGWTAEVLPRKGELEIQIQRRINRQLHYPAGWSRAGLKFVHTGAEQSMLSFRPIGDKAQMQRLCGGGANGCMRLTSPTTCTVFVFAPLALERGGSFSDVNTPFATIINHELGHCLGFGHDDGGVMNYGGGELYPEDWMIEEVRTRLAH